MEVRLERDGRPLVVEVDLSAGTVTVGGRIHPFRTVASDGERIELEIAGERVVVEPWPAGLARPLPEVSVNGERPGLRFVSAEPVRPGASVGTPPPRDSVARPIASSGPTSVPDVGGPGIPIVPPMPGKVVELRVAEGQEVVSGQVLLVLEAMKMRNDVVSPRSGRVEGLRVAAGTNVRAREPMLRILPS